MNSVSGVRIAGGRLLGALLTVGGCGYKTPPVPPATVVPVAIEDLRYTVQEDQVRLSWTFPGKNIKGEEINDIAAFDLYRAEIPLDEYCPTCPVPFVEPIEVDGGMTVVDGKRRIATYDYDLLRQGHKYFFKVQAKRDWWAASADSNIVTFVWHVPAVPPTGLTASAADSSVQLNWQPVTSRRDGEPVQTDVLYQLLRKTGENDYTRIGSPVAETSTVDRKVVNGQQYSYQVQSVLRFGEDLVFGGASEPVIVTPVDTTPPPVPTGVEVFNTGKGIRVVWEPSTAADVAGYNVYRRSEGGGFGLIGTVAVPDSTFVDESAGEDAYFIYAVTAYDRTGKGNESKKSAEAKPRY